MRKDYSLELLEEARPSQHTDLRPLASKTRREQMSIVFSPQERTTAPGGLGLYLRKRVTCSAMFTLEKPHSILECGSWNGNPEPRAQCPREPLCQRRRSSPTLAARSPSLPRDTEPACPSEGSTLMASHAGPPARFSNKQASALDSSPETFPTGPTIVPTPSP